MPLIWTHALHAELFETALTHACGFSPAPSKDNMLSTCIHVKPEAFTCLLGISERCAIHGLTMTRQDVPSGRLLVYDRIKQFWNIFNSHFTLFFLYFCIGRHLWTGIAYQWIVLRPVLFSFNLNIWLHIRAQFQL